MARCIRVSPRNVVEALSEPVKADQEGREIQNACTVDRKIYSYEPYTYVNKEIQIETSEILNPRAFCVVVIVQDAKVC